MYFKRYIDLLRDIIYSRRDLEVEYLQIEEFIPNREGAIEGKLRFWDGSMLKFIENLSETGILLAKTDYAYHYQDDQNNLIFRYDDAPHYPHISTHPHHKHIWYPITKIEEIAPATPPHLREVLREVDRYLYPPN